MTFRTRVLLAFLPVVVVALAVFGLGVRRAVTGRLTAQYQRRVEGLVELIREDLDQQSAALGSRLSALAAAARDDNRFRRAVQGDPGERAYLLDYAGDAMRLAGLSMLQIQDEAGRILSSGHFRNEFDRLEPELPRLLAVAPAGVALVTARTAEEPFLARARVDSLRLGARRLALVGGVVVDRRFLQGLARDSDLAVTLRLPTGALSSRDSVADTLAGSAGGDHVLAELVLPYVLAGPAVAPDSTILTSAALTVTHSLAALTALTASVDFWFVVAVLATAALGVVLAGWLASQVSRPLAELAAKTSQLDLDRLDLSFDADRADEIGVLGRLLGTMTDRLRAGARRLREVERRAAMGDLARQVNHDIKNALAPIRNVFRHLSEVARDRPQELPKVYAERQGTVESSVSYLESLASNYAKLSPKLERQPCDVNALVRESLRHVGDAGSATVELRLAEAVPAVSADPVALRRVIENLVGNAIEALEGKPGAVTVSTEVAGGDGSAPAVRLTVADTGKGMAKQELDRAFDDFFTTKAGGTGLGLTIVRRLVLDSNGRLTVQTEPGKGTRFVIELPADTTVPM